MYDSLFSQLEPISYFNTYDQKSGPKSVNFIGTPNSGFAHGGKVDPSGAFMYGLTSGKFYVHTFFTN